MRKLKCNCRWNQLTRQQRATMENWLFQDHLGYAETLARVESEFGVKGSQSSLARYYQRRLHERQATELIETQAMADTVAAPESDANAMRKGAVKLISKMALKIAFERPDRLNDLESLTKLLLMNEDIEIRRSRVKLERERFHYEAASAASEELPRLAGLIMEIDEDDDLNDDEKAEKVHDLLYPDEARLGLHKFDEHEGDEETGDDEASEEGDEAGADDETDDDENASQPADASAAASDVKVESAPVEAGADAARVGHADMTKTNEDGVGTEKTEPPLEEDPEARELKRVMELAKRGDALSAYSLGARYRDGNGVPKDLSKAREWLGKAASKGIGGAKIELHGLLMKYGDEI